MNDVAPVSARDLCDPFYHASIGSPLFNFDAAWWQDIVVHRQRELEAGDLDSDTGMMPMSSPGSSWKNPDDMQGIVAATSTSAQMNEQSYSSAAASSGIPIGVKSDKRWQTSNDQLSVEIPTYALQDPCSLGSPSSMSYSSSALLSPVSPGSRGSKRQGCTESTSGPSGPSSKRRRVSHDLKPATTHTQRQPRFFIDEDEADDEPATSNPSVHIDREGTWEVVQGAWWDTSKWATWGEWESDTVMASTGFSNPERPRGTCRGAEAPGIREVGPQSAPVICLKAMPPLRQPAPRLPPRAVDGAIEIMEHTARKRPRI